MMNMNIEGPRFISIGKIKDKRLKWFIKEILPQMVLVFISGRPKSGKSMCALHMALCLVSGRPFLGKYRTKRTKVLYYCLEDNLGELKARAKYLLNGKHFPKNLFVYTRHSISLPNDFSAIEEDIEKSGARVVIIDTLRRSHSLEENSSSDMSIIMTNIRRLVRECKSTIIIVHHTGHKIDKKENSGDWLRGTSDYDAAWEVLIGLDRLKDRTDVMVFHKYRSKHETSYKSVRSAKKDLNNDDFPIIDLVFNNPAVANQLSEEKIILEAITAEGISGNEIEKCLKGQLSRPAIDEGLDRLFEKGKVAHAGKGKVSKWVKNTSIDQNGRMN